MRSDPTRRIESKDMSAEPPGYPVESVDRALRLLIMIGQRGTITVSAGAAELKVARSTAHRLLATMQYHGFVRQDPLTKVYTAGSQVLRVGLGAVDNLDVRAAAREHLDQLYDQFDETVHLIILDREMALFVDARESSRALRAGSRRGASMPAYCTSGGKALLAQLAPAELKHHLPARLEPLTDRSITRREALRQELDRIREIGYATNLGESEPDLSAVAVAIPERARMTQAAISISAPSSRMDSARIREMAGAIRTQVEAIAEGLSSSGEES
jgi:IclR family acetate operon transcriptional repressor